MKTSTVNPVKVEIESFLCAIKKRRQKPSGFGNLLFAGDRRHAVAVLRAIASKSCVATAFDDMLFKHSGEIAPVYAAQKQHGYSAKLQTLVFLHTSYTPFDPSLCIIP